MEIMQARHEQVIDSLLTKCGLSGPAGGVTRMSGDGSDRIFYRLSEPEPLVAVFPGPQQEKGLEEARSSFQIGVHLADCGVAVPEILAYEPAEGAVLFVDLGDKLLHSVCQRMDDFSAIEPYYHQAIEALVQLQVTGAESFSGDYCWDTPYYDLDLMLNRESGYFMRSFCRHYMGMILDNPKLAVEFERLARGAARQDNSYLLHRDFQSRNLMIYQGRVVIIDFQGARFGPLAYDIASLLLDPYAELTMDEQEILFDYYLLVLGRKIKVDHAAFKDDYQVLAIQRNLQILGAFAFLTQVKGKTFFKQFIGPALDSLNAQVAMVRNDYPELHNLVAKLRTSFYENPQVAV